MKIRIKAQGYVSNISSTMTDISFLLIIFFIIVMVFVTGRGLMIILPDKNSRPVELTPEEAIELIVRDYSTIILEGDEIDPSGLSESVAGLLHMKQDPVAVITIGEGISYQYALTIVEEFKSAGVSRFSLNTEKNPDPKPVEVEDS